MFQEEILKTLLNNLVDAEITYTDVSHLHAGHTGNPNGTSGTHINLIIKSDTFLNLSRIACHRHVMTLLTPFFEKGLHAVDLKLSPRTIND
jgi:BolA protein